MSRHSSSPAPTRPSSAFGTRATELVLDFAVERCPRERGEPLEVVARVRLPVGAGSDALRLVAVTMTEYEARYGEIVKPEERMDGDSTGDGPWYTSGVYRYKRVGGLSPPGARYHVNRYPGGLIIRARYLDTPPPRGWSDLPSWLLKLIGKDDAP